MQVSSYAGEGLRQRVISRASHANKEVQYGIKYLKKFLKVYTGIHKKYNSKESKQTTNLFDQHIEIVPPEYYAHYSVYLKSQEWRDLRKMVLKRDKYRCIDCKVKAYHKDFCPLGDKLQVHHLHYDGIDTMTFTMDQLVSVCNRCHDIRHGRL